MIDLEVYLRWLQESGAKTSEARRRANEKPGAQDLDYIVDNAVSTIAHLCEDLMQTRKRLREAEAELDALYSGTSSP